MGRDHFIINVYCLVCEQYRAVVADRPLRRRGFAPALSDEEVITLEVCGEYLGFDKDEAIFDYFVAHYQVWFPQLRDRTSFVRHAANLCQVKGMIQQRLTQVSGQADDAVQTIDRIDRPVVESIPEDVEQIAEREAGLGYAAGLPLWIAFDLARIEQPAGHGHQIHRSYSQRLPYRGRFRQTGAHEGPGSAGKFSGGHGCLQNNYMSLLFGSVGDRVCGICQIIWGYNDLQSAV